ncbi:Sensor kinase CusS [Actinomadura rubteroloni]|uniref:histidine kinase n=1 Tax=Actinomadura rubteroloni TaxID=1926885 RepID=A0A2P4URT8_9ACTN|nr:HAMP domain-containing sensor histidine kinase [Actinomadura rubteroloni]POM27758.1 Sensor kinase CusS [Actinomadura rubteroloni]
MPERGRWRRPSRWSLGPRVTAVATGVFLMFGVVGAILFFVVLKQVVFTSLRHQGDRAVREVVAEAQSAGSPVLRSRQLGFSLLQIVDERGRVVAASAQAAGRPALTTARPSTPGGHVHKVVHIPGYDHRVYVVGAWTHDAAGRPQMVYAGLPVPVLDLVRKVIAVEIPLSVPVMAVFNGWMVWYSVHRAVRPVGRMQRELAAITGGREERLVTVPDTEDEVAELATSINVTLHRLHRVLERQRGFVADISHELRNPLTGLQAQLEVALESPEDEDWPGVARATLADADRLQQLVSDLLIMAKLDAGVPLDREDLELGAFAREEATRRRRRVPVEVDPGDGVHVHGSRHALARILNNLLDNAARHAAERIEIRVRAEGGEAVLTVRDDGAGIAPEDRERVFQRFQRLAESRRRDKTGSGLGLPISREIASAHGGTLVVTGDGLPSESGDGRGAALELRIPLADTRRAD